MKVKLLICLLVLFNILSCNIDKDKIRIIEATGLDANNLRLNTLFFLNKDTGFIAGSSDIVTSNPDKNSDTFAFLTRVALLFKTTDGGQTWHKYNLGEGSIRNVVQLDKKIYAFKASDSSSIYHTYSTKDLGATWVEEDLFPQRVMQLFFLRNKYIAITTDSLSTQTYIYISEDTCHSWKRQASKLPIYDAMLFRGQLFYLSSNDEGVKDLLVEYNIEEDVNKVFTLPHGFDCYFITNFDDKIRLIGKQDQYIAVYSLQDGTLQYNYSYLQSSDFFPQGYYNNNVGEWIVVGKRSGKDVSNMILKTRDSGRSWDTVLFEKEKYIKPFYFINEHGSVKAWFYSGVNTLQFLNSR